MPRPSFSIVLPLVFALSACSKPGGEDSDTDDTSSQPTSVGSITITVTDPEPTTTGTTDDPEPTPTTSDTDSDTATTGEDILNCGVDDVQADVRIPRVMLVLDKSGSMVADPDGFWDHDNNPDTPPITRWESLYSVVEFIVVNFEERMNFGAVLFPATKATSDYSAAACPVNEEPEVPVGVGMAQTILQSIPGPQELNLRGGTPAAAGIQTALMGLPQNEAIPLEDDLRYIIIVTDGAANCSTDATDNNGRFEVYDEAFPAAVAAAAAAGVNTFVVGIDISSDISPVVPDGNPDGINSYEKLNEVALAGGEAREGDEKFYNTVNELELQAALEAISEAITSCTFELSKPLHEDQFVRELVVDPNGFDPLEYDINEVTDCETESGWRFTDETRSAIELCGDACTLYKMSGDVSIVFECQIG